MAIGRIVQRAPGVDGTESGPGATSDKRPVDRGIRVWVGKTGGLRHHGASVCCLYVAWGEDEEGSLTSVSPSQRAFLIKLPRLDSNQIRCNIPCLFTSSSCAVRLG